MTLKPSFVGADTIRPSTYNPRTADPARLDLVELSLRKLGWLLPIFADAGGEILSGHQRHYVATERLGMQTLPVQFTKPFTLEERKAINIAFNRGTNDMSANITSRDLLGAITETDVLSLAASMPDLEGAELLAPIRSVKDEPLAPLLKANTGRWGRHQRNVSRMLIGRGILMPIVVDAENNRVINGIGRLEHLASKGVATSSVLRLSGPRARLAEVMLNLLTMDFDLHRRYENELRYNSFRRTHHTRTTLGLGFTFATIGAKSANVLDTANTAHMRAWRRTHGHKIMDFGAGHLTETHLLRKAGFEVTPFEPFFVPEAAGVGSGKDTIVPEVSRDMARDLLTKVGAGYEWDSLFISSVLNSVPFYKDRAHIVTLLAAMTGPGTTYAVTKSTDHQSWRMGGQNAAGLNQRDEAIGSFKIEYEEGTLLTDFSEHPKAQKYHSLPEFRALFATRFEKVQAAHSQSNCQVIASKPRPIDPVALAHAIDFEFDLMYPDGTSMMCASYGREQFGKRHGLDLSYLAIPTAERMTAGDAVV